MYNVHTLLRIIVSVRINIWLCVSLIRWFIIASRIEETEMEGDRFYGRQVVCDAALYQYLKQDQDWNRRSERVMLVA